MRGQMEVAMILKHELKAYSRTFLIWTLIIGIMNFGFMIMYPSLKDSMIEMEKAYANMGAFSTAFGMDKLSMAKPLGFYGAYVGATLSLGGAMFAALIGTGILSKEEGGHTSEYLYTLPLSRVNVVIQKILALFLIVLLFNIVNFILGVIAFPLIHEDIEIKKLVLYHIAQLFMHLEIGAIAVLLSAFLKKVNVGIGLGVALLLYFTDMMARVLEQLDSCKYITPFYYANAVDVIITESINMKLLVTGIIITMVCIIVGIWHYNRRDLLS